MLFCMGKVFSQELHDRYDSAAREAVKEYLTDLGWTVRDNPDIYGIDLFATVGNRSIGVEVECKRGWIDEFKFRSLHIPKRKEKFISPENLFFVLNNEMNKAAIVSGDSLALCGFISKATSETTDDDLFFEIPLKMVEFIDMENP